MKFKVSEEFIKEAHKAACHEWQVKIEEEFPTISFGAEFKIGQWYYNKRGHCVSCYQGDGFAYGFGSDGTWHDKSNGWQYDYLDVEAYREATNGEVEIALMAEAKKRGFVKGARFKTILGEVTDSYIDYIDFSDFWRDTDIFLDGMTIYREGKWATIIETITIEEAEKLTGKKIQR